MLSVLDVGDGACTVLRSTYPWHGRPIAIIDCGSNNLGADAACDRLLSAIGGHPEFINTVIVTHFDTDHYAGFLRLADRMFTRGQRFQQLNLIAPRPPEIEREYIARYLALAMTVTGIRNLDLANALRKVTVDGRFRYIPVSRTLRSEFTASDFRFKVHWPPAVLPSRVAGEVRSAIRRYEALANRLRERNNMVLENNLRITREVEWLSEPSGDTEIIQAATEIPESADDLELGLGDDDNDEPLDFPEVEALDLPRDLTEDFRAVWNAFRRANNNMSVIFDDQQQRVLAVFGDAGKSVLQWLGRGDDMASFYDVMLAPHHGTQILPDNFDVEADICISQNGAKRGHLWRQHVKSHHNQGRCTTTQIGSHHIHFPLYYY